MTGDGRRFELPGTVRARMPEETWRVLAPRLADYGITRVADVTGLDYFGIPVYVAVRPAATTLTTSQGKGMTPLLAKLSAVMEGIEVAVAETYEPANSVTASAAELELPYQVTDLSLARPSIVTPYSAVTWCQAETALGGPPSWLPVDLVALDGRAGLGWAPKSFVSSSNGLAGGNTRAEAQVHALLELIERHCVAELPRLDVTQRRYVDPDTVDDTLCASLIDRFRAAGCWVEIVELTRFTGIPVFAVYLWEPGMPDLYGGSGCHRVPGLALSRALTEAAQSRLSVISGTRDDIELGAYRDRRRHETAPRTPATGARTWQDVTSGSRPERHVSFEEEFSSLARSVTALTDRPVLSVDLTPAGEDFAVCRVAAPGLDFEARHKFQRPDALRTDAEARG